MVSSLFSFLLKLSPNIKKVVWHILYQFLAARYRMGEWTFMNYGFQDLEGKQSIPLNKEDEENRYFIQLYHFVATAVDVKDKKVLEVGSGRGGGASYIKRYLKPATMTGVDYSKQAVTLSNKLHEQVDNLAFVEGDAENLSLENNSQDVVINVESSHCYGNMPRFIAEVKRVLKPGGYFLFADLRKKEMFNELDKIMTDSGMEIIHKQNITPEVVHALDLINDTKIAFFEKYSPRWLQNPLKQFAGVKGSHVYNGFACQDVVYYHYVLKKKKHL